MIKKRRVAIDRRLVEVTEVGVNLNGDQTTNKDLCVGSRVQYVRGGLLVICCLCSLIEVSSYN